MCNIIYAKNLTKEDIKRIVNQEFHRYNKFHKLIKNRQHSKNHEPVKRLAKRKKFTLEPRKPMNQKNAQMYGNESLEMKLFLESVISDIKDFMRKEFEKLKTELQAGFLDK